MIEQLPEPVQSFLLQAAQACGDAGERIWLVGGVIRDLLLNQPAGRDIDLAIEGDVPALADELARRTGGRVAALHRAFGTATLLVDGADDLVIDLARTRAEYYPHPAALPQVQPAPIEVDLLRRDFSVNAIAAELWVEAGKLCAGPLIDPFAGQADLAGGRLRLLHQLSLRDDPTRILRGLRLAARIGLQPTVETQTQIEQARMNGYLGLLSSDRVLAELCLALDEPRPDAVLRRADVWGVAEQIVSGLVWSPMLEARAERLAADSFWGDIARILHIPHVDRLRALIWAGVLCYDLGGEQLAALALRYHLPADAGRLLQELGTLRRLVPALAAEPRPSALDRMLQHFATATICVLHYAELSAAPATERYLRELRPARLPLDGNDLQKLGMAPGPRLGHMLAELRAAWLDGEIRNLAEARERVRQTMEQANG